MKKSFLMIVIILLIGLISACVPKAIQAPDGYTTEQTTRGNSELTQTTSPNIGLEKPETEEVHRWGTDELLYQTDFELNEENTGSIFLYGKKTDEYGYGISDVIVQLDKGTTYSLDVQDGLMRYWKDQRIVYTESFNADGGLILEDVNFDGYTDIGLQVQTTAYNKPYIYWYYDTSLSSYCFLSSFLCPLSIDPLAACCTLEYHEGQTYYTETYKAEGMQLILKERKITEYIDEKAVTREDESSES